MKNIILLIFTIFILTSCWNIKLQNNQVTDELKTTPVTVKVIKKDDLNVVADIIDSEKTDFNDKSENPIIEKTPNIVLISPILKKGEMTFLKNKWISIKSECKNISIFWFKIYYWENYELEKWQGWKVRYNSCWFNYPYIEDFWNKVKIVMTWYEKKWEFNEIIYEKDFFINFIGSKETMSTDKIFEKVNEEILSIEEQYCISKWLKIWLDNNLNKVCIKSDWTKCSLDLFYKDKCSVKLSINIFENNKEEVKILTWITNIQIWKSWKYFLEDWINLNNSLKFIDNNLKEIILFPEIWDNKVEITNYELMYNKQIKVFYIELKSMINNEIIIDLNSILNN